MHIQKSKALLVFALVFGFVSMAAADWRMQDVNTDFSLGQTGVNTSTVQVVRLQYQDPETGNWNAVVPSNLNQSDIEDIKYYYNTSANASLLDYFYGGYWYADFQPNFTRGDMIKYNATGTTLSPEVPSNGPANLTDDLNVGELKVEVLTDIAGMENEKGDVKAGKQYKLDVRVLNTSSGNYLDDTQASVEVFYGNASGRASFSEPGNSFMLDNYNSQENYFYNAEVEFPHSTDSEYVMHVKATSSSGQHGTYSRILSTAPAISGDITGFSSSNGCRTESMVGSCEAGANISVEYNITNSAADQVNLSMYAFNSSGRHLLKNMTLSSQGSGVFTGEIQIPDLNTSRYMKKVGFKFNASNDDRWHVDRRNVTFRPFKIEDRSTPTAYTGNNYKLRIFLGKPYSLNSYSKDRFQMINVSVFNPSGSMVESFSMSELTYDIANGVMTAETLITSDMPTGSYTVEVNATNIYGETQFSTSGFNVKSQDATFTVPDSVEFPVNRLQKEMFYVDIQNEIEASNTLDVSTDLPGEVELTNSTVEIPALGSDVLEFAVNLTTLSDVSGSVTLTDPDTNYSETFNVNVNAADCKVEAGDICSETASGIEVNAENTEDILKTITLRNIGPVDQTVDFNVTIEGEVGQYMQVEGNRTNMTLDQKKDITFTYTPETTGQYSGQIVFTTEAGERLELDTTLIADLGAGNPAQNSTGNQGTGGQTEQTLTVTPSSISLGEITSGAVGSATITLENNGDQALSPVSVSSSVYDVSATAVDSISAGSSRTLVLTFNGVSSSAGSVTVTAGSMQRTIPVTAQVQNNFQDPNTGGNNNDTGTGSPGGPDDQQQQNQSGGGIPILPIAGIVILLLIIGFVFFTSYVPEEGDPLYDVLGEGQ